MQINFIKHKLCKGLSIAALILAGSGCATSGSFDSASSKSIPAPQWLNTSGTVTFLSADHSKLIENAVEGEIVTLGKTPWGDSTRLKVGSLYFSATGKRCFATTIQTATRHSDSTLCKYPKGNWGVTRATTIVVHTSNVGGAQ